MSIETYNKLKYAIIITTFFGLSAWFAAHEAIKAVAPVIIWGLGIFCLAAGLVAVTTFSALRVRVLWVRWAELGRDKAIAESEEKIAKIASEREYIRMVAEAKLLGDTLRKMQRGMLYAQALGEGSKFSSFPAQVINHIENAAPLLEAPPKLLLPAIADMQNILIVGGKGSGKTTLLQWLESERIGQTIALDSHAVPGQWSGQSVGAGRGYIMIKNAMIALVDKMDKRHKERTAGRHNFEPVHTIIDEFTLLPGYLKQADYAVQDYSFPMLTEGRKVDMGCLWGTHSDRAKPLGLEGYADLKECFDVIIYLKRVKGEFYAFCDFGEGKEDAKYTLPGPFNQVSTGALPEPEQPIDMAFVVAEPEPGKPSENEMAIIEAVMQVKMDYDKIVWSRVTSLLGWTATGPNNERIKAVLDKWNVNY